MIYEQGLDYRQPFLLQYLVTLVLVKTSLGFLHPRECEWYSHLVKICLKLPVLPQLALGEEQNYVWPRPLLLHHSTELVLVHAGLIPFPVQEPRTFPHLYQTSIKLAKL